jgi:hypothetical protein
VSPQTEGEIAVYLNTSPTTPALTFSNTTGRDEITTSLTGFTFIDDIAAADKPKAVGGGDNDNGIKVEAGGSGTLEVDAGPADQDLEVPSSTSSTAAVTVFDPAGNFTGTTLADGVTHLTLRTNDNDMGSSQYDPVHGTGDGSRVYVDHLSGGMHLTVDTGAGTFDTVTIGDNGTVSEKATVKTGAGDDIVNVEAVDSDDGASAIVDFGSDDPGGNVLNVHGLGTATVSYVGGARMSPIVIDQVNVSGVDGDQATLVVSSPATIVDLELVRTGYDLGTVDDGNATISADTTIGTLDVAHSALVSIEAPTEITDGLNLEGTVDFRNGSAGSTVDTLDFEHSDSLLNIDGGADVSVDTLETDSSGTIDADDSGALAITDATITNPLTFNLTTLAEVSITTCNISSGDTLVVNGGTELTIGTLNASDGAVHVNGGAGVTVEETSTIDELDVEGESAGILIESTKTHIGSLHVQDGGLVTIQPRSSGARVLEVDGLDLGSDGSGNPTGTLDLKDNDLIVGPEWCERRALRSGQGMDHSRL